MASLQRFGNTQGTPRPSQEPSRGLCTWLLGHRTPSAGSPEGSPSASGSQGQGSQSPDTINVSLEGEWYETLPPAKKAKLQLFQRGIQLQERGIDKLNMLLEIKANSYQEQQLLTY
ncbi:hypothetical protein ABBQ32_007071 [Trebouxia sp. C0010 RCD-2024]